MLKQLLTTSHGWTNTQSVPEQKMANFHKPPVFRFIVECDILWYGISIWLVWVICLVVPPPNLLCTPQSIHYGGRVRHRRP